MKPRFTVKRLLLALFVAFWAAYLYNSEIRYWPSERELQIKSIVRNWLDPSITGDMDKVIRLDKLIPLPFTKACFQTRYLDHRNFEKMAGREVSRFKFTTVDHILYVFHNDNEPGLRIEFKGEAGYLVMIPIHGLFPNANYQGKCYGPDGYLLGARRKNTVFLRLSTKP